MPCVSQRMSKNQTLKLRWEQCQPPVSRFTKNVKEPNTETGVSLRRTEKCKKVSQRMSKNQTLKPVLAGRRRLDLLVSQRMSKNQTLKHLTSGRHCTCGQVSQRMSKNQTLKLPMAMMMFAPFGRFTKNVKEPNTETGSTTTQGAVQGVSQRMSKNQTLKHLKRLRVKPFSQVSQRMSKNQKFSL